MYSEKSELSRCRLATVQRGDEQDVIVLFQWVIQAIQQLPVGVVHEHENARPHRVALQEEFGPFAQEMLANPDEQRFDRPRRLSGGQFDGVELLLAEQKFRATGEFKSELHGLKESRIRLNFVHFLARARV